MVFLRSQKGGKAVLWNCFHPGARDYGVSTEIPLAEVESKECSSFHPGERDYGVSTCLQILYINALGAVSIPASGIMVFLPWYDELWEGEYANLFPSRRAGLWCFYDRSLHGRRQRV